MLRRFALIVTCSLYVPGATKTRSPSTAAFTAAWMVEYCDGTSRSAAEASEAWTNTNRHDTIAGVFMAFSFWGVPGSRMTLPGQPSSAKPNVNSDNDSSLPAKGASFA
jgi:hypothetical protein